MVLGTPIVLNLIPSGARAVAHVNEVDQGAELQFAIYNGNAAYNVPEGVTATIRGTKGDGFGYTAAAAVTVGSNIITVTLDEQMTAVAGVNNVFELVLANSNGFRAGTSNFILDVERAALNENTVISDSDLAYAEQVLNDLQSVQAVNTQVQQNKAGLAAEIVNRQSADQTLQQNINAEAAARQAADNTLQSNINAEASTRATQDASLQSQIDQLVAPSGEAPSAAEVENARIGSDGTVYPTLGDAIRTQNSLLKSQLNSELHENIVAVTCPFEVITGYQINPNTGAFDEKSGWQLSGYIDISEYSTVTVTTQYTIWNCAFYYNDYTMASFMAIRTDTGAIQVPDGAKYLALSTPAPNLTGAIVTGAKKSFKADIDEQLNNISVRADNSFVDADYVLFQGALNSNDGTIDTSNAWRIATGFLQFLTETTMVAVASKYQSNVFFYSAETHGYISNTGWMDGGYVIGDGITIPGNAKLFRISLRNKANITSNISPSDIQQGEFSIQYLSRKADTIDLEKYNSLFVPTANPNIMYVCRDSRVRNDVPPNSKYAIKATAYNQYDRVRFSVTKTTDGEYVAVHDVTINGLAVNPDGTAISSTINTADCSLAELNQYDWGLKYGSQYAGLTVPMLDNCLKLASIYNLSVALDIKWDVTDADIEALTAMLAKYGQVDAIFFAVNPINAAKFKAKNKRFSYLYAGTYEQMQTRLPDLLGLLTGYNHVYLAFRPMGTAPTTDVVNFACVNNFDIMYSPIEGMSQLIALGFDKGITLMECHYIENIKTAVMEYADSLV